MSIQFYDFDFEPEDLDDNYVSEIDFNDKNQRPTLGVRKNCQINTNTKCCKACDHVCAMFESKCICKNMFETIKSKNNPPQPSYVM